MSRAKRLDRVANAALCAAELGDRRPSHAAFTAFIARSPATHPRMSAGASYPAPAALDLCAWRPHCRGLFQTPISA